MTKKPFVTKEKLEEIAAAVPTPFHIYDEKGIRENAKAVKEAFSWNPGFREYFAVKANPNPTLIKMLGEYVVLACACPNKLATVRTSTPCAISKLALVWRKLCTLKSNGRLFAFNISLKR